MIQTEEQRRWWFATHPEFRTNHKEGRNRREGKEKEESKTYSPEDVDAYVDEQLKYTTGREAELLKIVKRVAGTEGVTQGQDQQSRASEEGRGARDGDERQASDQPERSRSDAERPLIFPGVYPVDTVPGLRFPTLKELARLPHDMITGFFRWLDAFWQNSQLGLDPDSIERHHKLVKQYRDWFLRAGLKIDDHTEPKRAGEHRLKDEGGLHTGEGMGPGGWWSHEWREYINKHPEATKKEILGHLEILETKAQERQRKFKEMKRKSTIK